MDIKLRKANITDFHQMLKIYKELDEMHRVEYPDIFIEPEGEARPLEYIEKQIEDDDKYLIVAETDKQIVGFVECVVMESSSFPVIKKRKWVELNSLVVLKEYQGIGVGKMLLESVIKWSNEKRINRIELKVFTFNSSAKDFYSKAGFKDIFSRMYLDC
ncbi:GNAT family N-acetyltransferase [Lottiidibacillus patelloidae]|uniref:GNAT family N-acetyltransferase n=1 Tax=Lottiidibacillus patelloidae TaxID=2670334 RepID=A0A263BYE0_9BACI|nr:GNAT family N-acetyltransferase [Lottiidibacillus patelloidae]OZM58690.1 GNAT family N-acetyltransferase [Lottiidibacillus patelloidae]